MKIAVTGATGRIGGQVIEALSRNGGHELIGLARRNADYNDPGALRSALRGCDTLVFVSSDGEAVNVLLHHQNVASAATDAGVGHIVLLSSVDADVNSPFCYGVANGHTERLVRESGCAFSFARASIFTEFFWGLLFQARSGNSVRLPAGDARISLVSRADVAQCLAALALSGPTGRHHDLTGPQALDCAAIAKLAGCEFEDVTPQDFRAELAHAGEDAWWTYAYSTMFDSVRERRWETVTNEVAQLTGVEPTPAGTILKA